MKRTISFYLPLLAALLLVRSADAQGFNCSGDCNDNGSVSVDELVRGVNIALGSGELSGCSSFDADGDGSVFVNELVLAVNSALNGCPPAPTSTFTSVATETPTLPAATPTDTPLPETPTESPIPATPTNTPTGTNTPTATPVPTVGTNCFPRMLERFVAGSSLQLEWNLPPADSGCDQVRLLRRLNAEPAGPSDPQAESVYEGPGTSAEDSLRNFLPNRDVERTYHYAAYGCNVLGDCGTRASRTSFTPTLPILLRGGGFNIYWRHSTATLCSDRTDLGTAATTEVPNWWKSCDANCANATARQLDDTGRGEATLLGNQMRRLGIPFGRVLSSEFCRTLDTAHFMGLDPEIEELPQLTYFVYDEANRCRDYGNLVGVSPTPGKNAALIGHSGFPENCPAFDGLAWSEAAIFRPNGTGSSESIAHLKHTEWATLENSAPLGLTAAIEFDLVRLAWTPPDPVSTNTSVRLLRKLNEVPNGPDDPEAEVVFEGNDSSFEDDLGELLPTTSLAARSYTYAIFGCDAEGNCDATGPTVTVTPNLVDALRAGTYVLHWRHASATICGDNLVLGTAATTSSPGWWRSCDADCGTASARQLSDVGRDEAVEIGNQFRRLGIPVGRVLSSEFCRNFTTAQLMNFGPSIELNQGLTYYVFDEANRCDDTYDLIDEVPGDGTNTALIGHAGFPGTCEILGNLAWSEAAIFKPDGRGGHPLIERLTWEKWAQFEAGN